MPNSDYLLAVPDGLVTRPSGAWGSEKLDYLQRYINIFETSMRSKWSERNYIDLFAGPGKNIIRTTGAVLLGSPLSALTTKYPFTGYYFSELDNTKSNALRLRCLASPNLSKVKIYTEDANTIVDVVVANIRQFSPRSLNLAFLDPDGLELEWNTVAQLGSLRCDLIINYPQQGITRNMAFAYESDNDTAFDRFFGTRDWRKIYAPWHNKPRKTFIQRELIDFYKERLRSLGYQEVKQSDEILTEPLMRSTKRKAPLYRLVFASKHQLGEEFWKKVTRRDVRGQKQLF